MSMVYLTLRNIKFFTDSFQDRIFNEIQTNFDSNTLTLCFNIGETHYMHLSMLKNKIQAKN